MATKKQTATAPASLTSLKAADQQATDALNQALKSYQDLIAVSKANLDAMIEANTTAYNGVKQMSDEILTFAKARHEANLSVSKALSAAKTVKEAMQLQQAHVQASMESAISKSGELSESAVSLANQVIEPLQARGKDTMEKIFAPKAA
ncbi:MAG TPA: phasin family protein [Kiloniellaceae bacterium]|nr:phasin family protein [Kiloniellaceae bacterium]